MSPKTNLFTPLYNTSNYSENCSTPHYLPDQILIKYNKFNKSTSKFDITLFLNLRKFAKILPPKLFVKRLKYRNLFSINDPSYQIIYRFLLARPFLKFTKFTKLFPPKLSTKNFKYRNLPPETIPSYPKKIYPILLVRPSRIIFIFHLTQKTGSDFIPCQPFSLTKSERESEFDTLFSRF